MEAESQAIDCKPEPVVVATDVVNVQEPSSMTVALTVKLRARQEFPFVKGDLAIVDLLSNGEIRIRKLESGKPSP